MHLHTCPRDQISLVTQRLQGLSAGRCRQCAGLWLPPAVRAIVVGRVIAPALSRCGASSRLSCPADGSALVAVHHRGVEIDLCTTCGGVWLDAGELERILGKKRVLGSVQAAGEVALSADAASGVAELAGEAISAVLQFIAEALSGL